MEMKVKITEVDCTGVELNTFDIIPSKKNMIGRSRIFITFDEKVIGYFKVYEDGDIEFHKIIE